MDKTIDIYVNGSYLRKNSNVAGVQGEGNASVMHIIFDDSWAGAAKKITFWDSRGENPVKRILTNDLLVDITQSLLEYRVPIPPEPMAQEGDMVFVIDGYADGKRIRSVQDSLEVWAAMMEEEAGEPSDPTPTQAEQLQAAIEDILPAVQEESRKAQEAAASAAVDAESAQRDAEAAQFSAQEAGIFSDSAAESASAANISAEKADAARISAEAAETTVIAAESAVLAAKTEVLANAKTAEAAAASAVDAKETAEEMVVICQESAAIASASSGSAQTSAAAASGSASAAAESESNAKASENAAKTAQTAAEKAAAEASAIVGGDFITAAQAEEKISAAVTPVTEALNKVEDILPEVFIAAYGTTTSAEIEEAYQAGKAVFMMDPSTGSLCPLSERRGATSHFFVGNRTDGDGLDLWTIRRDVWSYSSLYSSPATHAGTHKTGGSDPITPESIGAKPATESDVFIATYGTTTNAEIEEAYQAGKAVYCKKDLKDYRLTIRNSATRHIFSMSQPDSLNTLVCYGDSWTEGTSQYKPQTHASTHAAGGTDPITPASIGAASAEDLSAKQDKHISAAAELAVANWSGNTLLASVPGVTENNTVIVTPTPECIADWQKYKIFCQSQFSGELEFACETVPDVDIYANVVILGV